MWPIDIWPYQVLALWARVDQAMKGYYTFPKSPRLEPRNQMVHVISRIHVGWGGLPVYSDAVGVFYNPSQLVFRSLMNGY